MNTYTQLGITYAQEIKEQRVKFWTVHCLLSGGGSRLESVGEDDELIVENGDSGSDMAEKTMRGGRKHSLPQQLDTVGVRQVSLKTRTAHLHAPFMATLQSLENLLLLFMNNFIFY